MKITRGAELSPPRPQNFIRSEYPTKGIIIPVEDLDEEEAKAYGQILAMDFYEHWKSKKNNKTAIVG